MLHSCDEFEADSQDNSVDLPALNETEQVNITSTGDLDCVALAAKVVNATPIVLPSRWSTNDSVICNSKKASVTTYRAWHPSPTSGSSRRLYPNGYLMTFIGCAAVFGFVL